MSLFAAGEPSEEPVVAGAHPALAAGADARRGRRGWRTTARCASSRPAARRSCSASANPMPTSCSSVRARASRKTSKASRSSAAAGKLLTQLIEGIGLTRDDVYIANVVKCRPPGNRDPEPDEIDACAPWLDRQLELDPAARDRDARQLRDEAAARHEGRASRSCAGSTSRSRVPASTPRCSRRCIRRRCCAAAGSGSPRSAPTSCA